MPEQTMVRIRKETLSKLNSLKGPGQSHDGLLTQLIEVINAMRPSMPWEGPPLPYGLQKRWQEQKHKQKRVRNERANTAFR